MVLINTDGDKSNRLFIKETLYRLVRGNEALITFIEKLVIMNSKIAVQGSMVLNHLVVYYAANNIPLPELNQSLIYDAFNFGPKKALTPSRMNTYIIL